MFGNLKFQLGLSSCVALTLLAMGIWAVSHRLAGWGIAMFAFIIYLIG